MAKKDGLKEKVQVIILGDRSESFDFANMVRQLIEETSKPYDGPEKQMADELEDLANHFNFLQRTSRPGARFGAIPKGFTFADGQDDSFFEELAMMKELQTSARKCGLGIPCGYPQEFPFGKPSGLLDVLVTLLPEENPPEFTGTVHILNLLEDADGEIDQIKMQIEEIKAVVETETNDPITKIVQIKKILGMCSVDVTASAEAANQLYDENDTPPSNVNTEPSDAPSPINRNPEAVY